MAEVEIEGGKKGRLEIIGRKGLKVYVHWRSYLR
jgi:hypothetical protein